MTTVCNEEETVQAFRRVPGRDFGEGMEPKMTLEVNFLCTGSWGQRLSDRRLRLERSEDYLLERVERRKENQNEIKNQDQD